MEDSQNSRFHGKKNYLRHIAIVLVFAVGLLIRFYDLTDPPLDFHETRQLGSALIARGMYYQMDKTAPEDKRNIAIAFWHSAPSLEPQILERLVAITYLVVRGEYLWIARIYSSIFWVLGAVALYLLAKEISSPTGAIIATGIYLFLPYGIFASRSFQPDPLMVCLIVWASWFLHKWIRQQNWRITILTGLLCGSAILIKPVAIFPLLGAGLGLVLISFNIRQIITNKKIWAIILLSLLPAGIYFLYMSRTEFPGLVGSFIFSFQDLLAQPRFYIRWFENIDGIIGFGTFISSLLGVLLITKAKDKAIVIGLWGGYILFGLAFPYHFMSHNYYHLMIIPIAALSISKLAEDIFQRITEQPIIWKAFAIMVLLLAAGFQLWNTRVELVRADYHAEVKGWKRLARELPKDGNIIAITQSYGYRLEYYGWVGVNIWPNLADIKVQEMSDGSVFDYQKEFEKRTDGMDYFLITNFSELESQPELKSILYNRDPNPVRGYANLLFTISQDGSQ